MIVSLGSGAVTFLYELKYSQICGRKVVTVHQDTGLSVSLEYHSQKASVPYQDWVRLIKVVLQDVMALNERRGSSDIKKSF